jgi:hypothetical protein
MTLTVDVYRRDEATGDPTYLELDPGKELAGVENYRWRFWGAPVMESLGLSLLPLLRVQYGVSTEADGSLDQFEHEAQIILENADLLEEQTTVPAKNIRHYAGNILSAIAQARAINGHVIVW